MSTVKMTGDGFEIKTFFTSSDIINEYPEEGSVYVLRRTAAYTCHMCNQWVRGIPYSSPGNRVHDSYINQIGNIYYIVPNYGHSECVELFKLCPPLE